MLKQAFIHKGRKQQPERYIPNQKPPSSSQSHNLSQDERQKDVGSTSARFGQNTRQPADKARNQCIIDEAYELAASVPQSRSKSAVDEGTIEIGNMEAKLHTPTNAGEKNFVSNKQIEAESSGKSASDPSIQRMNMIVEDYKSRNEEERRMKNETFRISNSIASNGTLLMQTSPQGLGEMRRSRDLDKTSGSQSALLMLTSNALANVVVTQIPHKIELISNIDKINGQSSQIKKNGQNNKNFVESEVKELYIQKTQNEIQSLALSDTANQKMKTQINAFLQKKKLERIYGSSKQQNRMILAQTQAVEQGAGNMLSPIMTDQRTMESIGQPTQQQN